LSFVTAWDVAAFLRDKEIKSREGKER